MRSYDYVVVGAGSAGCVLAARLTEDDAEVLLLEAGPPDSDPNIWRPAAWPALWGTERDYGFSTVAQKHAAGRPLYWPRGRTLGGSSAVNGMIYVRGHRADYDAWAYDGCLGWDYASVLPYFKKSEDYEGGPDLFHGVGGPLNVARNHNPHPVCRAAVEAAIEAGFPFNADFNGADTFGVGYTDLTIKDGRRQSAATAFLGPASNRSNLSIRTDAQVLRLRFRKDRCVGVEVDVGGQVEIVAARREVILSAGTIGSPQILMLSGIGNARALAAAGIDVIHPLRGVGRNLHDHLLCSVIFEARRDLPPPQNNFLESQLFCKSDSRWLMPDLQPLFMHLPYYPPGLEGPSSAWTLCAGIVRPASRGFMRLAPGHPRAAPLLDPNILASDADLQAMEQAIAICRDIGNQPALADWRKREILPGPDVRGSKAIRDYIRRAAVTYHHQVGTCRMGTDADAVVDPELRVHGLSGLRVADASVMPSITSGNTNAPTIMIAEKAAAMIRATE